METNGKPRDVDNEEPIDFYFRIMKAKLHYLHGLADGMQSVALLRQVEDMRKLLNDLATHR